MAYNKKIGFHTVWQTCHSGPQKAISAVLLCSKFEILIREKVQAFQGTYINKNRRLGDFK